MREKLSKKGTRAPKETSKQASLRAKTCLSLFLRPLVKSATGLTSIYTQLAWMKRGKTLDAEDLQNEFATLIDVAESFSSSSAPMDCRDSTRPIALSGINLGFFGGF